MLPAPDLRFPCSPWKSPCWSRGMPKKKDVSPWEARAGAASMQGPVDPWREELMVEQLCWKTCGPVGDPDWGRERLPTPFPEQQQEQGVMN